MLKKRNKFCASEHNFRFTHPGQKAGNKISILKFHKLIAPYLLAWHAYYSVQAVSGICFKLLFTRVRSCCRLLFVLSLF